jgi:hypothetical protein
METSAFRSTLYRELSTILPCGVRDYRWDSRTDISIALGGLVALGKMTCLNWKSDAPATVIRPLPKGNGISA